MEVRVDTPKQAVIESMQRCLELGEYTTPRNEPSYEILNYNIEIRKPWNFIYSMPERNLNPTIGALELAGLIGQCPFDWHARNTVKSMGRFQDECISYGSYGSRVRGQLENAVATLSQDTSSRRAVVSIYDGSQDLQRNMIDIPCTLTMQFFIRHQLHMRTSMRSNDVWLGLPYDLMMFCGLHASMAQWLGYEQGTYYHSVGSMHLYTANREDAKRVVAKDPHPDGDEKAASVAWSLPSMSWAVTFCQDMLMGRDQPYGTELENWLMRYLCGSQQPAPSQLQLFEEIT